jgi:hypothetical protein
VRLLNRRDFSVSSTGAQSISAGKKATSDARRAADRDRATALFRQIAADSSEALLLAGRPVHPDAELLDLCGGALERIRAAELALQAVYAYPNWDDASQEQLNKKEALLRERSAAIVVARTLAGRARKLRAKTGAGIYAKALVIRNARTGAPMLAKSLADDLLAQPNLRAVLWPAEIEAEGGAA